VSRVEINAGLFWSPNLRNGLVAVSGGADSVALALAIHANKIEFTIVHVNHKLRGEESDADEQFVRDVAEKLSVPFRSKVLPIPEGASIEDTARNLRYDWFRELAKDLNSNWVATAHTADDQAETVLHRLIRGTGLKGLGGIPFQRLLEPPDIHLYRPMLLESRSEIVGYLATHNQPYRNDSSNSDLRFTRNRIRNEIMPILREINPQVIQAINRLAAQAMEWERYVTRKARDLLSKAVLPRAGEIYVLKWNEINQADEMVRLELFRIIWQSLGWPMENMSDMNWRFLAALKPGDYPGGVTFKRAGTVVQLQRKS